MKFFAAIVLALVASAQAAPRSAAAQAEIVSYSSDVRPDAYQFQLATSDGKQHQEAGQLQGQGENEAMVTRGSFSYVGDDGKTYTVNYVADENGFRPEGDHLPKPQQ